MAVSERCGLRALMSVGLCVLTLFAMAGCDDSGGAGGFDTAIKADRVSGNAPLTVTFSAQINGPLDHTYVYEWAFEEGDVTLGEAPSYTFEKPGTYSVTLGVKDEDDGARSEGLIEIEVTPSADIQVAEVSLAPRLSRAGGEIEVAWGLRNVGADVVGEWDVIVFASEDDVWDADDLVLSRIRRANDQTRQALQGLQALITLPEAMTSGDWFVGVVADPEHVIGDSDRDNNISFSPFTLQIRNPTDVGADLQACGLSIPAFDNVPPNQMPVAELGDQLEVRVCIANLGNRPAPIFGYQIYLSSDEQLSDDDLVVGGESNLAYGQGDRGERSTIIEFPFELTAGSYHLLVVIDAEDKIQEQLEDNNQRVWPGAFQLVEPGAVEGVDLVITGLEVDTERAYWGQQLGGTLRLLNRGDVDVQRLFVVRITAESVQGGGSVQLSSLNVPGIGAGEEIDFDLALSITRRLDEGEYTLSVIADPTNALMDVNPGNNRRNLRTPLTLGGEPDLDPAVGGVSFGSDRVEAGDMLRVEGVIRNLGTDPTGPLGAVVVLSQNNELDVDDVVIAELNIDSLDGDETFEINNSIVVPLDLDQQVGTWWVGIVVDPDNRLTGERSEENNVSFAPTRLVVTGATGGCAEDPNEQNDVPAAATRLAAGTYENLGICDDADWYGIELPPGQTLDVRITWDPAEGTPNLRLADIEGVPLRDAEPDGEAAARLFVAPGPEVRTLLFQVTGGGARLQYGLEVALTDSAETPDLRVRSVRPVPALLQAGGVADVVFEVVNVGGANAPATVAAIAFGADAEMAAELGRTDVPALETGESAEVTGRVTVPEGIDDGVYTVLVTVDPDGVIEEGDEDDNSASGLLRIDAEQACPLDPFEPNGSPHEADGSVQLASNIMPGNYMDLAACLGDDDWYSVSLLADQRLDVRIGFDPEMGDLDLELYDVDGEAVLDRSNGLQNTESVSLLRAGAAGDYFIRVRLNRGNGLNLVNRYQLQVDVADADDCQDDGFEPNGDADVAMLLPNGRHALTLCPGDEDWFRFNIPAGNTVSFQLAAGDADVRIAIFTPDGELGGESQQRIAYQAVTSGFHVLRVIGAADAPTIYELTVSGVSGVDLAVEQVQLSTDEVSIGDDLRARVTVANLRGDDAANVTVRFLLSADEIPGDDDVVLAERVVPRFAGAAQTTINQRLSIPFAAMEGATFIIVEIDPEREVPDLRVGNNVGHASLTVSAMCVDDDPRDNEGPETATNLAGMNQVEQAVICAFTEDWYRLPVVAGELVVRLNTMAGAGDLDLLVYDEVGEALLGDSRTELAEEVVGIEILEAGAVLIRVDGFLDARNTYDLSWEQP